jgi:hypothetical protein
MTPDERKSGRALTAGEKRLGAIHFVAAVALAVVGRVMLAAIEPLPDGTSAFEAILSPELWIGLFLIAGAYILFAAATGWAIGLVVAIGLIVSGRTGGRVRQRLLIWMPPAAAVVALAVGTLITN